MDSLVWGLLVLISLVWLIPIGWHGFKSVLIFLGTRGREVEDVSHLRLPPAERVQETVEKIIHLGFKRLGEAHTRLPLVPGPTTTWVFVDEHGTTHGEVVDAGHIPMVLFSSNYQDGAVLETGYPLGEKIDTSIFRSFTVRTNICDAYSFHQDQMHNFNKQHGEPQKFSTMVDYLHGDSAYRLRHAWRKMRRLFILRFIQSLSLFYTLAILFAILTLVDWSNLYTFLNADWFDELFLLLLPALIMTILCGIASALNSRLIIFPTAEHNIQ
jgi:hypothetical protein